MYQLCHLKPDFLSEAPFLDSLVRRLIRLDHGALHQFLSVKPLFNAETDRDVENPVAPFPVCPLRDNRTTNRPRITKIDKTIRYLRIWREAILGLFARTPTGRGP